MELVSLTQYELQRIKGYLPTQIIRLMQAHPGELFVAGGFIRDVLNNEHPNDVDLFAPSYWQAKAYADEFVKFNNVICDNEIKTENAITLISNCGVIQFIHRWTYRTILEVLESFDFTIAQAAVTWSKEANDLIGSCSKDFHADLEKKVLVYTSPVRDEAPGGSLLRINKFLKRGYRINVINYNKVLIRLLHKVDFHRLYDPSFPQGINLDKLEVITLGLLREVDPLLADTPAAAVPLD